MELELGLALATNPTHGFDLNSNFHEHKESIGSNRLTHDENVVKKRTYKQAFYHSSKEDEEIEFPPTLPLLFSNQPNDQDDDPNPHDNQSSLTLNKNEKNGNFVMGWPPIKARKKSNHHGHRLSGNPMAQSGLMNSMYVKVMMEGTRIGRKIDLSLYDCYEELTMTLLGMFGKCLENVKNYRLTYLDREGDWLLAGAIPWRYANVCLTYYLPIWSFIASARRLKLVRSNV
ncbi:AUX/IAA domain [Dillenia turbinata]|uniref:Auxin-responsive protein n=1 Tax=Dillenia turbinata TaxID=194707 RepID=A0AAN8WFT0_9MAGN